MSIGIQSIQPDFKNARLTVEVASRQQVPSLLEPAKAQGFLLLQLQEKATKPFMPHQIEWICEDGFRFVLEARPVQFFDRNGLWETAFQLDPWTPQQDEALQRALASTEPSTAAQATDAASTTEDTTSGRRFEAANEGETQGASPMFRIKAMNPNEKARLAMSANRAERQLLRRDKSPQVLVNLLANPRAEAEDVLAVVKSPYTNSGLLDRVAKDRRWNQNAEIRTAIARNPKAPSPTVIRLLDSLRTEDLKQMARVGALRENVRREALRVYMKRTGQRA